MRVLARVGSLSIVLLIFHTGCSCDVSQQEIEEQNMAIVRQTHAALANGDLEAFKAALAPNYVRHCQAMPPELQEIRGTEPFLAFIEEFVSGVGVYQDTIGPMIAQGDMVAYVSTMTGTQTGPIGDLPASGKTFTVVNIIIQRLEGGKVAETWVSWDNVAMLSQLGFFAPPVAAEDVG
jgi:predicted ester cyclase